MPNSRRLRRAFLLFVSLLLASSVTGAGGQSVPVPKSKPSPQEIKPPVPKAAQRPGLPDEERTCRKRLEKAGVRFHPVKRIYGKNGCGIRYPVEVTRLPDNVRLSGRTVLSCPAAEALAGWSAKSAGPEARKRFGSDLVKIDQYASYDCRTRNSQKGSKLSEHAKGNAIDLGRFHMSDGTVVDVASRPKKGAPEQLFLKALRKSGCTFFTTVLGPGSDAFHDDHFHFDVAKRRSGYRYCK
ncbi:extensin family protein [Hoeflea prorocentri]|uniref:Extensin family protein n=1 Tax=Hoeflea prorocentri TaxID=1922333 RepID=A0A9X3ZGI3_9HYPH|nr:extensin family protein [Hoeflea prorocentri]MCY6380264.1 extensin family protein [Hoeflea prorocentri]MDA5398064.1 extensin family protein [Hoeflea prorocentri]